MRLLRPESPKFSSQKMIAVATQVVALMAGGFLSNSVSAQSIEGPESEFETVKPNNITDKPEAAVEETIMLPSGDSLAMAYCALTGNSLDGCYDFPQTYTWSNWKCNAHWYQECEASENFHIPSSEYEYCSHAIAINSIQKLGLRFYQVTTSDRGVAISIRVKGSWNPLDQWGGWFDLSVSVKAMSKNASTQAKIDQGCIPATGPAELKKLCKFSSIPTGWTQIDHENNSACNDGDGSGEKNNQWILLRYENLAIGSVIDTCAAAQVPGGWEEVKLLSNINRCITSGVNSNGVRRIRRVS